MEPINGLLSNFIKKKILKKMSPEIESLLFVADRYENINSEILPQLRTGEIIVSNRYVYAFLAYQGSQRLNLKRNVSLNFFALKQTSIYIDAFPEIGYIND